MNKIEFHNASSGSLERCQISDKNDLELVIDLGHQPLCDSLLNEEQLKLPEKTFPLRLYRSKSLGHGQLDYVVPGDEVYFPEYPYRPGITKEVVEHHKGRSDEAIKKYGISTGSFVVDIGSNDGTLLSAYKERGMKVLGVEPTNTSQIANEKGIETIQEFFTESTGENIVTNYGKAKLVTSTNVFAHMATLGEVILGIKKLLADDGLFILENHYIVDILKNYQFDTIYHEHIRSYSLTSLVYLFRLYNMKVIDAEIVERYGGTLRATVSKDEKSKVSNSVDNLLSYEKSFGLFENHVWDNFRSMAHKVKNDFLRVALSAAENGERFVGKSCPGRCSTLLNFFGIGKDLMPYIAEQPTSFKKGLYLPGRHIPIVDDEVLFKEQPDYVVILAWHYWKSIVPDLKKRGLRSKFVIPLPTVKIID